MFSSTIQSIAMPICHRAESLPMGRARLLRRKERWSICWPLCQTHLTGRPIGLCPWNMAIPWALLPSGSMTTSVKVVWNIPVKTAIGNCSNGDVSSCVVWRTFIKVLNIIGTFRFTGYRRSLKKSSYYAQASPETWHPPFTDIITMYNP